MMIGISLSLGSLGVLGAAGVPAPPVPQIPPANLSAPVVSDTSPQEGQLLDTTLGVWANDPEYYSIQWQRKADGAPDGSATAIDGADDLTYILPLGAYVSDLLRVAVTATNEAGSAIAYSAWTLPVAAAPTVPGQVTGVDVVALSPTSIHIMFTPVSGATSYEYQLNGGSWFTLAENGAVEGLTQNTLYSVAVRALNSVGAGAASAVDTLTTPAIFDGQPLFFVSGAGRPVGLGYAPAYAPTVYNHLTDIPGDAVYLSAQGSWNAAYTAARATTSKTLVVDQDVTIPEAQFKKSNLTLLGVPVSGRLPNVTASITSIGNSTPCLMYAVDGKITARGIRFTGFADVFGLAVGSINTPTYPTHGEGSAYGFPRFVPAGMDIPSTTSNGNGIGWGGVGAIGAEILGSFDICDCEFYNCEGVGGVISDSSHPAPIHFHRNKLVGTWGGLWVGSAVNPDVYCSGNEWSGCTGAREITNLKANHYHTFLLIGPDASSGLKATRRHTIIAENNYLHDVTDSYYNDTINCAVGFDFRNVYPTMTGWAYGSDQGYACRYTAQSSVRIAYNSFKNLVGSQGQEDANAIYGKPLGIVVENNRIENCGSKDQRGANPTSTRTGGETSGILFKNPGAWLSTSAAMRELAIIIRWNEIIDPPTHDLTQDPALYSTKGTTMKVDGDTGNGGAPPTYMVGNKISRWHWVLNGGSGSHPATFRTSNYFPSGIYIEDNDLIDCRIEGAGRMVILNSANSATVGAIKDNRAFDGQNVTYTANRSLIDKRGSSCSVSGNRLVAEAQPDATATFSAETATASAGTPRLEPRALPETETSIRVRYNGADVSISNGAIS